MVSASHDHRWLRKRSNQVDRKQGHCCELDKRRNRQIFHVYYIVSQTNPENKQVNNVLVKRGKELHQPDRMYLSPNQLLFVEPVGTNSKVAQLIAQAAH